MTLAQQYWLRICVQLFLLQNDIAQAKRHEVGKNIPYA